MAKATIVLVIFLISCATLLEVSAFTDLDGNNCPCMTTDDLRYVCGSDGVTYDNRACLECEKKCKRLSIEVLHEGKCGDEDQH